MSNRNYAVWIVYEGGEEHFAESFHNLDSAIRAADRALEMHAAFEIGRGWRVRNVVVEEMTSLTSRVRVYETLQCIHKPVEREIFPHRFYGKHSARNGA